MWLQINAFHDKNKKGESHENKNFQMLSGWVFSPWITNGLSPVVRL
jgi:hypothetical protein